MFYFVDRLGSSVGVERVSRSAATGIPLGRGRRAARSPAATPRAHRGNEISFVSFRFVCFGSCRVVPKALLLTFTHVLQPRPFEISLGVTWEVSGSALRLDGGDGCCCCGCPAGNQLLHRRTFFVG